MTTQNIDFLKNIFQTHLAQIPEISDYKTQLNKILSLAEPQQRKALIDLYDQIFPLLEKKLWGTNLSETEFDKQLEVYQELFRKQESLQNQSKQNKRYHFILSIPIADRPDHLKACLESIFQLCMLYNYGGVSDGFFTKVLVIIVEDSKEQQCIDKDIQLAEEYTKKGLKVYHYGLKEQYDLMLKIPVKLRQSVSSIIGDPSTKDFYHKGQAITRNLSYLKALDLTKKTENYTKENTLYFFVDSDQLFQTNLSGMNGDRSVYGLNYFYYINRLFHENNIAVLSGKLVGDPPVSPSVMAVNFLEDVIAFLQQLSTYQALQSCQFHPESKIKPDDAAYHDMAQLFGFDGNNKTTYDYCCSIHDEEHDNIACLKKFCERINYFFFGEHLTRKTYFNYHYPLTDITPARTVYPGNYITTFDGLKYIIAFGKLRLRMSGPTAGRLIQSEIKEKFASSYLPMLHTRTLQGNFIAELSGSSARTKLMPSGYKAEFRPGVEDKDEIIDLSNEFERQFFGDLMLFSVARLTQSGIAIEQYHEALLTETFVIVENELLDLYAEKQKNIKEKCRELEVLMNDKNHWWNQLNTAAESVAQLQQFINNIVHNFSKHSTAWQQIQSKQNRQMRIKEMIEVLLNYHHDRSAWDTMLSEYN
ncbi:MAG: hypothetical protein KZQ83_03885 [gamma proteobacterium symbiont of Taylorina sp.]|nr:hypothetical protein [gamma proteobacterium symbiont of Taylorina sp.]